MQHQDNINSAILLGVFSAKAQTVKPEKKVKPVHVNSMPQVAPSGFETLRSIAESGPQF